MKKTKTKLLVVGILTTIITTSTPVFATTNSGTSTDETLTNVQEIQTQATTDSSVKVNSNDNLSTKELSSIKEDINSILSSKYEIMKTGKSKDYSNIIGDSKLLELVNKINDLDVDWFKKFTKIDTYNSNVNITNSTKTANNTYVLDVLYDVKFKLHGMNTLSQSENEKYRFEVKSKNDKWYITKMVDLNNDDDNQINVKTDNIYDNTSFSNYDDSIDLQIKNIDQKSKNIDNVYKYFKVQTESKNEKLQNKVSLSDYEYDPDDAVRYARKYAESPNPAYHFYNDEDCTNFVSQCVYAGGIPQNPGVWMPGQYDWTTVLGFYSYMTNYGYATGADWTDGARIGDVVQWYNPSRKQWSHAVILTGSTSDDWLFCSHTNNRKDYPLYATFNDSTFTDLRTIEFWH